MLKDILAISGQPGLYKLVSNTKNGIIVENLETKKRMPAYATAKVSALEDIAIYTEDGEDKPLGKVLISIREKENGGSAISQKAGNTELKKYFEEVMPEFDQERVYVSDIKKVIQWYNIIQKLEMLDILDKKDDETEEKTETEVKEEVKAEN
ncbi:MAG: DUF5606 domain-containing protein [Salinivirgaceae bacterium]|nr:DUF5606 domain-containing protein [Salinivirgaceae bacterium]